MIRASVLALFATLMICGFCGKEFESLGRHSWRCKSKVEYEQEPTVNAKLLILPWKCLYKNVYPLNLVKQSNVAVVRFVKELAVLKCTNEAAEGMC